MNLHFCTCRFFIYL